MNTLLNERGLLPLTIEKYREIFDFPVRNYYQVLGFDFEAESFEKVGMEFMVRYNQKQHACSLHSGVKQLLTYCRFKGFGQSILSAREQHELTAETVQHGVRDFFHLVYGLDDHYAHGKTEVGFRLIRDLAIPEKELIFIGDTLHDAEVAQEIGIDCILVPVGHHSEERIRSSGLPVFNSLAEFIHRI